MRLIEAVLASVGVLLFLSGVGASFAGEVRELGSAEGGSSRDSVVQTAVDGIDQKTDQLMFKLQQAELRKQAAAGTLERLKSAKVPTANVEEARPDDAPRSKLETDMIHKQAAMAS